MGKPADAKLDADVAPYVYLAAGEAYLLMLLDTLRKGEPVTTVPVPPRGALLAAARACRTIREKAPQEVKDRGRTVIVAMMGGDAKTAAELLDGIMD